jgi:predicted O-methyltransferase YrrM
MIITSPEIDNYCEQHTGAVPEYLERISRSTHLKTYMPRMLSGHIQGRLLAMLSKMMQPERILEIGTFTGYSALCLAEGLTKEGELITLEKNDELLPLIREHFALTPLGSKITLQHGDASVIIPTLTGHFDLVFIDADKENYTRYFYLIQPFLKSGSVIIADNVLWSGKIMDPKAKDDDTVALREFNALTLKALGFEQVMLPVRDGLTLIRKK